MSNINTKPVVINKFRFTSHAQNRIVDPKRKLKKSDIIDNVYFKPIAIEEIKLDRTGRASYARIGKFATMQINPFTNNVTSVWRTNINVARKYNYYRKGRKYVKKS